MCVSFYAVATNDMHPWWGNFYPLLSDIISTRLFFVEGNKHACHSNSSSCCSCRLFDLAKKGWVQRGCLSFSWVASSIDVLLLCIFLVSLYCCMCVSLTFLARNFLLSWAYGKELTDYLMGWPYFWLLFVGCCLFACPWKLQLSFDVSNETFCLQMNICTEGVKRMHIK